MYQGKHVKRAKYTGRPANQSKATVLLTALIMIVVLVVGTTAAFLIASDGPISNLFNPSQVSCQVNEESFDGTTKTNVTISNTGNTEAYIRAAIIVTWKDAENGNVYGSVPVAGENGDYTISLNLEDWMEGRDGYYYYVKPVAPGASTAALIDYCKANQDKTPAGYGLNVEILGSAIQSVPISVVNEKWPAVKAETPHGDLTKAD